MRIRITREALLEAGYPVSHGAYALLCGEEDSVEVTVAGVVEMLSGRALRLPGGSMVMERQVAVLDDAEEVGQPSKASIPGVFEAPG